MNALDEPLILLIGGTDRLLADAVQQRISGVVNEGSLRVLREISQLSDPASYREPAPDVIVVVQSWPDEYSIKDANLAISRYPQASLICCYGPWCDADGRTRSIWPLAVRVPLDAFADRLQRELRFAGAQQALNRSANGESSTKPGTRPVGRGLLPLTASRTEIFEHGQTTPRGDPLGAMPVAILSPDQAWKEMLGRMLNLRGADWIMDQELDRAQCILLDVDPWSVVRANELAAVRRSSKNGQLIACTGFPNLGLREELLGQGANQVWFKLAPLGTLTALLSGRSGD
ncbi:MAG: hypothetical protein JSS02_11440 [Planctomycetes bacterium]|nr:hypothetical protein [Planctomycetota bacterium]